MPLLMLLVVALLLWTQAALIQREEARVDQANETRRQINHVSALLARMESGQRGYLITSQPTMAEPFERGRATLPRELDRLIALVQDDPAEVALVRRLRAHSADWVRDAQREIELRGRDDPRLRQQVMTNHRAGLMTGMQRDLQDLRRMEIAESEQQTRLLQHQITIAAAVAAGGLAITVAIFGLFYLLQRRAIAAAVERIQIHEQLIQGAKETAIYMLDPNGRVMSWNYGARKISGYTEEEILGKPYAQMFLPEDVAAGKPQWLLREAVEKGRAEDQGWRRRKDGTRFWAQAILNAVYDRKGRLAGFAKVTRDLTRQHQDRLALERFATIIAATDDAIFSCTTDLIVETWNPGAEKLYGYSADEMVGHSLLTLVPPAQLAQARAALERLRRGERIAPFPSARLHKDGHLVDVSINYAPLKDCQGQVVGIAGIHRDITAIKRAEAALRQSEVWLRESEARYRRLVEVSPEAIVVVRQGRIVYANPAGARLVGAPGAGQLLGASWLDFIHPEDLDAEEHQVTRLDGTKADVELTACEVSYQGEPATLALVRDITERKRAMERLALKTVQLEQAQELGHLKDHFLSTMSHEMKTPLSLITGYAELLEDKYPDEDLLVGIQDGARRLADHISNMLDYTALISGTLPLYLTNADPNEVLAQVEGLSEPSVRDAGLELKVEQEPDLPPVRCDERRVVQVLVELVENARKFTPEGGKVTIKAAACAPYLRVEVQDTGPCIPDADRERVWEAFTQLETRDATRRGGLGLGLTIVKHLVELHDGQVQLGCNDGTIVTVLLPLDGPRPRPKVTVSLWPSEAHRPVKNP